MIKQFIRLHIDFIGFSASLLCALHCAALPFILSLTPLAGLRFMDDPLIENGIILLSFAIATYALIHGYRKHHRKVLPLIIVVIGFGLIGAGHFIGGELLEVILSSCGAMAIAVAHLINWQQIKKSRVEFPDCLHHSKSLK